MGLLFILTNFSKYIILQCCYLTRSQILKGGLGSNCKQENQTAEKKETIMECPSCFNTELVINGNTKISRPVYLQMQSVGHYEEYEYHQCPRCMKMRKCRSTVGVIEEVTEEEAVEISKKIAASNTFSLGKCIILGSVVWIGAKIVDFFTTKE
jgi:hypothetical protein